MMAVGGIGGLFGQLLNPNLDRSLAAGITPDPRPLAQMPAGGQGAPGQGNGPPPPQTPSMAPAAVTQPDPITAQYNSALTANADRLRAARMDAYGADLNRNIEGIAAGFGTAQQQASKTALLGRGGGVGDSLADLAASQKIGELNVADSEHARFMGNVTILAQRMGVTPAEIIEMSNTKEGRDQIANVIGGNLTATGTMKDADAATRAWAAAHPEATPQEINDHRASLLEQQMGGQDPATKAMNNALRVWNAQPENKGKLPPDYLTDPIKYKAYAESTIGTSEVKAKDLLADQRNYSPAARTLDEQIKDAKDLLNSKGFEDIYGGAINAGKSLDGPGAALLSDDTKTALALQNKLISGQYTSQIQDMHGMGRITQQEMERGSPAQSTVAKRAISVETARKGWEDWITKQETKKANFAGAAGQLDTLTDDEYKLVNPIYKPGGDLYVPGQRIRVEKKEEDGPSTEQPPAPDAKKASDGNWYVPDPARPGKYLRVN